MAEAASFDIETHALRFAPEYGANEFSDHLPMTVTAMRQLGADQGRIDTFARDYLKKLKRRRNGKASVDEVLLSAHLGDPDIYPAALNYFREAIANEGRASVLANHLPELTSAIATASFHGVIRVAFGLIADCDAEIAAGLAYWHAKAANVRFSRSIGAANNDSSTLLEDVASTFSKHGTKLQLDKPTVSDRIAEIVSHPRLNAVLARAAMADVSFDEIASIALRMYLASEDFTAMQAVSGVHATHILSGHVVMDDRELRRALWTSVCAAYASVGAPALPTLAPPPSSAPDWRVISSAALSSEDEHVTRFVYCCMEEARTYGRDALYRYAAGRRLGLI